MTRERKKELEREIVAYATEQENPNCDTPRKILQELTDDIGNHIAPLSNLLIPFYIAALEYVAKSLRAHFPKASELAEDLKEGLTCYGIVMPYPKNK